ncbi:hypothetical protein EC991_008183 [Linnemannia zychae]|nr:hypothetical protein EC991_008183 [Linnemannia zychae]
MATTHNILTTTQTVRRVYENGRAVTENAVFGNALYVRSGELALPFLRGSDFKFLDPHRIAAIPGVTLDVVVAGATGVASPPSSALQQIGQQAALLPRYNPLSKLQPQWSPIPHFTTSNNTPRTFNQNQASAPHTSRSQPNNATTRAQKRAIDLCSVQAIIRNIAVCIDLDTLHAKGDGRPQDFWMALECYLKKVHKGQTQALISVGDLFIEGDTIQQYPTIAMGWYLKAAYLGDNNARHKIEGLRLELSRLLTSPQEPPSEGLKDAQQDKHGNDDTTGNSSPEAITILANTPASYSNQDSFSAPPLGVPSAPTLLDPEFTNMMREAELGVLVAQDRLQSNYKKTGPVCISDGVKTAEYFTAIDRYHRAVVQGNPSSRRNLGNLHFAAKDYTQAMTWYKKAAKQDAAAYYNIGYLHYYGYGVSQDYAEAMRWYRKAVDQGNANTQHNIGVMYQYGQGVSQDYTEAVSRYRKAADQGYANAQHDIGYMYQHGHGVSQDYAEAMRWYRKAADQGYAYAQNKIGYLYHNSLGVSQDYAEAMRWYRKAADQRNASAQHNVGFMYRNGRGVFKDMSKALEWYKKAALQGDSDSEDAVKELEIQGYIDHGKRNY